MKIINDVSYSFGKFVTFNRRGLVIYFSCKYLAITSPTYRIYIVYSIITAEKMSARLFFWDAVKHFQFHKMTVGGRLTIRWRLIMCWSHNVLKVDGITNRIITNLGKAMGKYL